MTVVQALGAFPLPAGFMLVPDSDDPAVQAVVEALGAGRLPESWPEALRAHELAHAGELEAAQAALTGNDPYTRYNRYLLDPDSGDAEAVAGGLPADLAPLVDVLRYATGASDDAPALAEAAPVADVVAALVVSTQATQALDEGRAEDAAQLLREASQIAQAQSPALSAILLGNAGTVGHEHGLDREQARADLNAAIKALMGTHLAVARAELHHQLGMLEHELAVTMNGSLRTAMHHYYTALQLVTEESAPILWASAQLNLATAHMSSTMIEASDDLRTGIAIQAMRASLRVFTRDEHPLQWATTTLNLANALIYSPSVKQGDNLVEAVELYEEVLELRNRDTDPLGRARVLANQGNALAHLGIFDEAKAKLFEARFLFEEHLDSDSAMAVRGILDEIAKQKVGDPEHQATGRLAMGGIDPIARGDQGAVDDA